MLIRISGKFVDIGDRSGAFFIKYSTGKCFMRSSCMFVRLSVCPSVFTITQERLGPE